jgi:hypothetical protein
MVKKNKKIQKNDAILPPIELNLSSNEDAELPIRVIVDCKEKISEAALERLRTRLRLINPEELRHLNCVRIASPSALKLGTHVPTQGCYKQATHEHKAEVWISSELFGFKDKILSFFNWLSFSDRLFEVLYHEIGHHKAAYSLMVSKHKHEAYAEKFMLAYKKAWMKKHGPSRLIRKAVMLLILTLTVPFMLIFHCIKPKDPMNKLVLQRIFGRISREEYNRQFEIILHSNDQNKKPRKWIHPLEKLKYRKKFHIDT